MDPIWIDTSPHMVLHVVIALTVLSFTEPARFVLLPTPRTTLWNR
jgi:hypothetical protein